MGKIITIDKDFFFVISKTGNEDVFFFDIKTKSIKPANIVSSETINNKIILKIESKADGYYIVNNNKKLTVIKRGNVTYYLFLKNKSGANTATIKVPITFVDGTSQELTFNQLKDNIYYYDASTIDRPGWIGNDRFFGVFNKGCFAEEEIISAINSSDVNTPNIQSSVSNNNINSDIKIQDIDSEVETNTINTKM